MLTIIIYSELEYLLISTALKKKEKIINKIKNKLLINFLHRNCILQGTHTSQNIKQLIHFINTNDPTD
jgi:hypothetical protein